MKLCNVVSAIIKFHKGISGKDIEATILFLVCYLDVPKLRRVAKELNALVSYEDAPVN